MKDTDNFIIVRSRDFEKKQNSMSTKTLVTKFGQQEASESQIHFRLIWRIMMTSWLQDCVILENAVVSLSERLCWTDFCSRIDKGHQLSIRGGCRGLPLLPMQHPEMAHINFQSWVFVSKKTMNKFLKLDQK